MEQGNQQTRRQAGGQVQSDGGVNNGSINRSRGVRLVAGSTGGGAVRAWPRIEEMGNAWPRLEGRPWLEAHPWPRPRARERESEDSDRVFPTAASEPTSRVLPTMTSEPLTRALPASEGEPASRALPSVASEPVCRVLPVAEGEPGAQVEYGWKSWPRLDGRPWSGERRLRASWPPPAGAPSRPPDARTGWPGLLDRFWPRLEPKMWLEALWKVLRKKQEPCE
ncbi:hypothetical protein Agub_g13430 [Astrephomene gubernaculifera]|uniref:Uncharacterized protein n=1 Tax=Astrephomene gubernaculifera TaxID=47775 RepID=A0AAD3DZT1_9CHLO|nr:hypothetical protein Agub_g13430 [Astrephomene gubernaculifera]